MVRDHKGRALRRDDSDKSDELPAIRLSMHHIFQLPRAHTASKLEYSGKLERYKVKYRADTAEYMLKSAVS